MTNKTTNQIYVLGYNSNIVAVFATEESAKQYVLIDYPDAEFDADGMWSNYWVEAWDVL